MDYNYGARMSQQFRSSQQQQQRTKKKEDDPDLFMRLVSLYAIYYLLRSIAVADFRSPIRRSQDVSAT
jgi:hypothetical protein